MRMRGSISKGLLTTLVFALIPLSAYGTNHAGPKTPSCGNYKVSTDEIIVGVKFPRGIYQINTFGISCSKVMGSKGLFAKFLKLKDSDPLPKPWRFLEDAIGAPKFSSGPAIGFRAQLLTPASYQDEVSLKIDQIRTEALKSGTVDNSIQTFIFQNGATQEVESKTKRSLLNALPVYKKLGFNTTNGLILVARDIDWVKQELLRNQCNNNRSIPDRPGFYYGNTCINGNGAITSFHWESEKFNDGLDGLYFNHVIPHEYFHQIQEQLTTFGNGDFPKWFWEGSAQFFTNQAWSSWNTKKTYLEWYQHWWGELRPDLGPNACKSATIEAMSNPSGTGTESICAYSKGQLIVEYLVYKYGMDKYRSLYTANTNNDWKNFNIVFKKVTGEELSIFYESAHEFIIKRGW